jgi:hypothetical protein
MTGPSSSAGIDALGRWFPELGEGFVSKHYVQRVPVACDGRIERFGLDDEWFADGARFIRSAPVSPPLTVYLPGGEQIQTDPFGAATCYARGCTVSIESAVVPAMKEVALSLGNALGSTATVAAVLSRVGEAVPAHFDAIDAFVLMIRGRKRWTIAPNQVQFPNWAYFPTLTGPGTRGCATSRGGQKSDRKGPLPAHLEDCDLVMPEVGQTTFELKPGSVAFVPSGWWHRTECFEDSVSYTVRIGNNTVAGVVAQSVMDALHSKANWRAPLPLLFSSKHRDEVRTVLVGALRALARDIADLEVEDVLHSQLGRFYQRTSHEIVDVCEGPSPTGHVLVNIGAPGAEGAEIDLPIEYLPPLQWIAARKDGFFRRDAQREFPALREDELGRIVDLALDADLIERQRPVGR